MKQIPRVLILSRFSKVLGAARLPRTLARAGFEVAALRPNDSLLASTRYVEAHFSLPRRHHKLFVSLISAIKSWQPALIIPGDVWSTCYLQRVATSRSFELLFPEIACLLRSSLGDPKYYGLLGNKRKLQDFAQRLSIRTPHDKEVKTQDEALRLAKSYGYPVVVKTNSGSGGKGVWICSSQGGIEEAFYEINKMRDKSLNVRSLVRTLIVAMNHIPFSPVFKGEHKISMQKFIDGVPVAYNFVAMQGELLAANMVYKRQPNPAPTGPCCILEKLENKEVDAFSRAIIYESGFSGFGAFDYMIDRESGEAFLLECNQVPTSISHLGEVLGADLGSALYARLTGVEMKPIINKNPENVVAMFPHELIRNPLSKYVRDYYHDVPLDDPDLLNAISKYTGVAPVRHLTT